MVATSNPLGQAALIALLDLRVPEPGVRSYAIDGTRKTVREEGQITEFYPRSYEGDGTVASHLRFMLRYEAFDLGVLSAAFQAMDEEELVRWVKAEPSGRYSRRAWFLYEWLTGRVLDLPQAPPMAYVAALDPDKHVVLPGGERSRRHGVIDNLPGVRGCCPLIRWTDRLRAFDGSALDARAREVMAGYEPRILARAMRYLYTRETRASFEIEREKPGPQKEQRFVEALQQAATFDLASKGSLVSLQADIVDPRYKLADWRDFQNFVGHPEGPYGTYVPDCIFPRPADVASLMADWQAMSERLIGSSMEPVLAAAVIAFTFVFIHPFWDGNGRIHRFLIHNVLARKGFGPKNAIFPVSASIVRSERRYYALLDEFSLPRMPFIDWRFNDKHELEVANDTADLYRTFDATAFAEFLVERVKDTLEVDLNDELTFLRDFDRSLALMARVVDMPSDRASLFARLCFQNGGKLSKKKRAQFAELSDEEITELEEAIAQAQSEGRPTTT